jgi:hypothetical protein
MTQNRQPLPAPEPMAYTFRQFYTTVYPCSRARAHGYVKSGEVETFTDRGRRMVRSEGSRVCRTKGYGRRQRIA